MTIFGCPQGMPISNQMVVAYNDKNRWFALRVPYGRELRLKVLLDSMSISNFVPMQNKKTIIDGKDANIVVPAIRNLIFVNTTRSLLDELKVKVEESTPFRYIIDKSTNLPIEVPSKDMEHFIAVAGSMDEQLIYLTEIKPTLIGGDKVVVTGGIFAGVEGNVVRIKKDRRVMVSIDSIAAVVTAYINPLLLKKIEA